jgi:nitrile hydratase accessory protein
LSAPDLAALRVPTEGEEPVFAEPWEAQAFALAVQLHAQGAFTWPEWAAALADAIKADPEAPYYERWLAALETLALAKGLTDARTLHARKHAWEHAYETTPHGKPVELPTRPVIPEGAQRLSGTAGNTIG